METKKTRKTAFMLVCVLIYVLCAQTVQGAEKHTKNNAVVSTIMAPDGTASWNGHTYNIFTDKKYWQDAEDYCESLGGHLLTIDNADEQVFIVGYLLEAEAEGKFMLGLHSSNGNISQARRWVTGDRIEYTNWGEGQPDDGQNTVIISTYDISSSSWRIGPYQWGVDEEDDYYFICEWEPGEFTGFDNDGRRNPGQTQGDDLTGRYGQDGTPRDNGQKQGGQEEEKWSDDPEDYDNFDRWLFDDLYDNNGAEQQKEQPGNGDIFSQDNSRNSDIFYEQNGTKKNPSKEEDKQDGGNGGDNRDDEDEDDGETVQMDKESAEKYINDDYDFDGAPALETKPMTLYTETGLQYLLPQVLDHLGKDTDLLMPKDISVTMEDTSITVHLPMIAGHKYISMAYGWETATYWPEYADFRDEVTLHGTIERTGVTYEGEGYKFPGDGCQFRPCYYFVGTIDSAETLFDGSFTASFSETTGRNSQEICSLSDIGSYQRDGENIMFSKFTLYYFPDDDFFEMDIFLFGDFTQFMKYPEDDMDYTLNFEGRKMYEIQLVSEYEIYREGNGFWDWIDWE